MAGATLEFDNAAVLGAIRAAADALADPALLLDDMGHALRHSVEDRFVSQTGPDGRAWQALSPAYLRSKKKNKNKILTLNGYLGGSFTHQVNGNELLVGTNRIYAAIQHFGGQIDMPGRVRDIYFKQGSDGTVGSRFVAKRKSNFAQQVSVGPYTITIPARPFLGTSTQDEEGLLQIANKYLSNAISNGSA